MNPYPSFRVPSSSLFQVTRSHLSFRSLAGILGVEVLFGLDCFKTLLDSSIGVFPLSYFPLLRFTFPSLRFTLLSLPS